MTNARIATSATDVASALAGRQSLVLTSHARPDGDAIGSQIALGLALERLGKTVRFLNRDPVPEPYRPLPAADRITLVTTVDEPADAVVLLECGDVTRPGLAGLEHYPLVNIDHHPGNALYGNVNWIDESAAACGELVADLIDALGVPWDRTIATHLFLAITTDTGGFRYGPMSARTFDVCRRVAETGVDLPALSRQIFDSHSIGRLRLTGSLLHGMSLDDDNRIAILQMDDVLLAASGATSDDTEGLVNLPLSSRSVLASVLIRAQPGGHVRVSLRSKGALDVGALARLWGGGGHRNAAGVTLALPPDEARRTVEEALRRALGDAAPAAEPGASGKPDSTQT